MGQSLPKSLVEILQQKHELIVKSFTPIAGGCINNGGKLVTSHGNFFIKWNSASKHPGMFQAEALGLKLLSSSGFVYVPTVCFEGEVDGVQYIVMTFVGQQQPSHTFWEKLGRDLASLHGVSSDAFGLDHNNYIGSLPQSNTQSEDWVNFFIHQRLEPQLQRLNPSIATRKKFDQLYKRLPDLFPEEKPSLLHGDLWSGNLIRNVHGEPCLIDPAVYFGHREMEIAFTRLFGGFDERFYDTYKEVFPLQPGFKQRIDICNLYPRLVHANLFGGHYVAEIDVFLNQYS